MKEETIYICDICGWESKNKELVMKCESVPVKYDKGVIVGDIVKVINGEYKGQEMKVVMISVERVPYRNDHHELYLEVSELNKECYIYLSHDNYEVLERKKYGR